MYSNSGGAGRRSSYSGDRDDRGRGRPKQEYRRDDSSDDERKPELKYKGPHSRYVNDTGNYITVRQPTGIEGR